MSCLRHFPSRPRSYWPRLVSRGSVTVPGKAPLYWPSPRLAYKGLRTARAYTAFLTVDSAFPETPPVESAFGARGQPAFSELASTEAAWKAEAPTVPAYWAPAPVALESSGTAHQQGISKGRSRSPVSLRLPPWRSGPLERSSTGRCQLEA